MYIVANQTNHHFFEKAKNRTDEKRIKKEKLLFPIKNSYMMYKNVWLRMHWCLCLYSLSIYILYCIFHHIIEFPMASNSISINVYPYPYILQSRATSNMYLRYCYAYRMWVFSTFPTLERDRNVRQILSLST